MTDMGRIKRWLIERWLPTWAREEMLDELRRRQTEINDLREHNARLQAYIDGLEAGIRAQRRIIINTNTQSGGARK